MSGVDMLYGAPSRLKLKFRRGLGFMREQKFGKTHKSGSSPTNVNIHLVKPGSDKLRFILTMQKKFFLAKLCKTTARQARLLVSFTVEQFALVDLFQNYWELNQKTATLQQNNNQFSASNPTDPV